MSTAHTRRQTPDHDHDRHDRTDWALMYVNTTTGEMEDTGRYLRQQHTQHTHSTDTHATDTPPQPTPTGVAAFKPRHWVALAALAAVTLIVIVAMFVAPTPTPEPSTPEKAPVSPSTAPQAPATGDDNRDGRIDEDESGWDCRAMGNRVCGTGQGG